MHKRGLQLSLGKVGGPKHHCIRLDRVDRSCSYARIQVAAQKVHKREDHQRAEVFDVEHDIVCDLWTQVLEHQS